MLLEAVVDESVEHPAAAAHTESLSNSKWCPPGPPAPFHMMFEPAFWTSSFPFPASVCNQRAMCMKHRFSITILPVVPDQMESLVDPSPTVA